MVELADVASPDHIRFNGALASAVKTSTGLPVASHEHLAAMKYMSYRSRRAGGRRRHKWMSDRMDLQNLLLAKPVNPVSVAKHIHSMMKHGEDHPFLPQEWMHDHEQFVKHDVDFPEP
jgi:hypothetical protein